MDWLVERSEIFGFTVENWMLAIGGGLLVYFAVTMALRPRRTRVP